MAEGSSNSTGMIVLSISTAVMTLAAGYFGYQTYNSKKDLKAFHDAINTLPKGSSSVPAALIPKGMMDAMNRMT